MCPMGFCYVTLCNKETGLNWDTKVFVRQLCKIQKEGILTRALFSFSLWLYKDMKDRKSHLTALS